MKALAFLTSGLLAVMVASTFGQAPAAADQRLREQVRLITTQLRTAETERAALLAEKATLEATIKRLEKQTEEIAKQMAADKDAAKTEADRLRAEISAREAEIAGTKDLLVKADTFGKQSAELARKTEAERARLAGENLQLKRVVADQRVKNAKMYELGTEILSRYAKFGLGTAISAREPFVGITRARLEALAEEYGGDLAAQRIRLDDASHRMAPGGASSPERTGRNASRKKKAQP